MHKVIYKLLFLKLARSGWCRKYSKQGELKKNCNPVISCQLTCNIFLIFFSRCPMTVRCKIIIKQTCDFILFSSLSRFQTTYLVFCAATTRKKITPALFGNIAYFNNVYGCDCTNFEARPSSIPTRN